MRTATHTSSARLVDDGPEPPVLAVVGGWTVTTQTMRRAVVVDPDLSGMALDTPEILAAVEAAHAALAGKWAAYGRSVAAVDAVDARPSGPGSGLLRRAARTAADELDAADVALMFARRAVNQAVRAANPNASEAQINVAARSL